MCASHEIADIDRRSFAAAIGVVAGLGFWPLRARAAGEIDALCVMCIDYRLVDGAIGFFDKDDRAPKAGNFDLVALAGASLSGVLTKFPEAVPGFWKQIDLARDLHHIKKVVVLDHRDCGAYKAQFGIPRDRAEETRQHVATMTQVKQAFANRYPAELGLEFFLMDVINGKPGPVDRIAV